MTSAPFDLYTQVTEQIVTQLETGLRPWIQPWTATHSAGEVSRPLRFNAIPYRGINVILLWLAAIQKGFTCPLWMTYKQATELGGQVRGGSKGSHVVYADRFTRRETHDKGNQQEREIPFLKTYTVFNSDQIDGLPPLLRPGCPASSHHGANRTAERFFGSTGADIRHGGGAALYVPNLDFVQMPTFECFRDAEGYYATLAHEICHNAASRIMPRRTWNVLEPRAVRRG